MYKPSVPTSKRTLTVTESSREIIGIYWEDHRERSITMWQDAEFLHVTAVGTHSYHWALEGLM